MGIRKNFKILDELMGGEDGYETPCFEDDAISFGGQVETKEPNPAPYWPRRLRRLTELQKLTPHLMATETKIRASKPRWMD